MKPDLLRAVVLVAAWVAVTLGVYLILRTVLPAIDPMVDSLWIIGIVSVLVAAGVTALRWWRDVGYTPPEAWRETRWLIVPAVLTLVPLVAGLKPMEASAFWFLVLGYALTGFAEETMFRGVLVKLLAARPQLQVAAITAVMFGLVHLSNILIRGNPAVIAAQAVGAAAFGFGYAALRMRTNTIVPLVVLHMLTDLFLQLGNLPLIPVAVGQDVALFALGIYLLRASGRGVRA